MGEEEDPLTQPSPQGEREEKSQLSRWERGKTYSAAVAVGTKSGVSVEV